MENKIICADVLDGLKEIPDGIVTLVVTSPPYNVNAAKWDYATASDDQPYADYVEWLSSVFKECFRVLRKGGRLAINIDAMTNRQDDKPLEYLRDIRTDLANVLRPMGFRFYGEHVWYKSGRDPSHNGGQFNGKKCAWGSYMSCSTPAVRRNHEYVLVYSKDQFTLEKDEKSGNTDITGQEFQNYIASVWSINAETRNMGNHPVPFPEDLVLRCAKLYSYPNDLILDPFNGIGTTTFVAQRVGRRYIGIDMSEDYCRFAENRITGRGSVLKEELPEPKPKKVIDTSSIFDDEGNE